MRGQTRSRPQRGRSLRSARSLPLKAGDRARSLADGFGLPKPLTLMEPRLLYINQSFFSTRVKTLPVGRIKASEGTAGQLEQAGCGVAGPALGVGG
jgi:hypothetical protein